MKRLIPVAALFASALLFTQSAEARDFKVTYEGTITEGTDYQGFIGAAGADLTGMSYKAVQEFAFPAAGTLEFFDGPGDTYEFLYATLATTTSVTIGGHTFSFQNPNSLFLRERNSDDSEDVLLQSTGSAGGGLVYDLEGYYLSRNPFLGSPEMDGPFRLDIPPAPSGPSFYYSFVFQIEKALSPLQFAAYSESAGPTSVELVAMPEPSLWGMMILGFGGVGALFRRRAALAA